MNRLALSTNRRLLPVLICLLIIAGVCVAFQRAHRPGRRAQPRGQDLPVSLLAAGDVDLTFNPTIERPGAGVFDLVLQPDGKSLIGGAFTTVNGVSRPRVARLNSDGSVDTTFNPGVGPDSSVFDLSLQTDGKVLLAGPFTSVAGVARNGLARLNSDGSLDTTFVPALAGWESVNVVCAQADGKVLFGGSFLSGFSVIRFRRLNSDGSVDSAFTPTFSGVLDQNTAINVIVEQADGKILVGGDFVGLNNTARTDILRVNSDGSLDTAFNPNTGAGSTDVLGIAVQTDGKILVGGDFTTINGTARNGVARLNSDGTLDTGFNPGTGLAGGAALSFGMQTDGKVLLAGQFITVNGSSRSGVARVNGDGSLDAAFNPGTGTNSTVFGTGAADRRQGPVGWNVFHSERSEPGQRRATKQ